MEAMLQFYLRHNMFIGGSAAANLHVAYKLAKKLGVNSTILTVFPSLALQEEKNEILIKARAYI